jgi:anaerobic dimethyl sulfoxide reductase subunit A
MAESRLGFLTPRINLSRRSFLKATAASAAAVSASNLSGLKLLRDAKAFAYEPYLSDDQLETVVTSCAHNCGSRHVLVAHKKGDVVVRLSSDDGRFQSGGHYGKDTFEEPQLRACLRGRAYRQRLYSPDRLLYPMIRVGARGERKFKRASWDVALDYVMERMLVIKAKYGPTALLDQSYAGAGWGVLHTSDQLKGPLGRFLGMFGCRTASWSVPSYEGTAWSSKTTFGTINDGNEDDVFAHSKLIIMWGWNPAYTFHGGNTVYYMRLAKQKGCKFVLVDPQYTDSAAAYDAWWIPIKPATDAAMMAAMAQHILANDLQDQEFIDRFCQGVDAGTMPEWAKGRENFKDYLLGRYDGQPKTPEWAEPICGVAANDIKKLARLYATTKPAALKASWAPGRNAYGEQYSRMAAALQTITGNIGVLGGSSEGIGQAWPAEGYGGPRDEEGNPWAAAIKSDRWAHCVLNYPHVRREEIGLWPLDDHLDGVIPNIRGIFWQASDWLNQLPNVNKNIEAIKKLDLVVCMDSTITPSGYWADVLLPVCTHFERHDVSVPWYKGHYYIHRPKVIEPLGESKSDWQIFTELAYRIDASFARKFNPKATREYFDDDSAVDEAYLREWWDQRVMGNQGVEMSWEEFKKWGIYKFKLSRPHVAFQDQIEKGIPFETPSGKIEIFSTKIARIEDWRRTEFGYPVPAIPMWIEPWESLNHARSGEFPFHLISPHPRWRTHSIFQGCSWLRETYEQEVTLNASDARRLGIRTGDAVEIWNDRGRVVAPAYVTERCRPGVAVLHEGAWMDLDDKGVDRAGNPDFLTLDRPSPVGAFAFNTVLVNIGKSTLEHRPGWDKLGTSRAHVFRRDD